ncbi:hypothetical protein ACFCYB_14410 [Streptomyces sp. NPDC056309]|uniref:hypothetical protein n=1 Tax=unclassified Streptomyces TaxID=2593676 RepID=UPI0035E0D0AB
MRARRILVVAAASACVFLPATSAVAGTGPAPSPDKQHMTARSATPSETGNPMSVKAQAAGVCTDAYQIGTTAYIDRGGTHVASVKQFYSPKCSRNYGYLWVWQSFRDKIKDYDVSTGVYSYARDKVVGQASWKATNVQEFWSLPADTVTECTAAIGSLRAPGDPVAGQAVTSKRC